MPYIEFSQPLEKLDVNPLAFASEAMTLMLWPEKGDTPLQSRMTLQVLGSLSAELLAPSKPPAEHPRQPRSGALQYRLEQFARDPRQFALDITALPWLPELIVAKTPSLSVYISTAFVALTLIGFKPYDQSGQDASVNKAAKFLSKLGGIASERGPLLPKHHKDITDKWGDLKRVAHFWAAYTLMAYDWGLARIVRRDLETFFALSRAIGTQLQTALQREVDLWLLPKALDLPVRDVVVPFDIQEVRAFLNDYAADYERGVRLRSEEHPKST